MASQKMNVKGNLGAQREIEFNSAFPRKIKKEGKTLKESFGGSCVPETGIDAKFGPGDKVC